MLRYNFIVLQFIALILAIIAILTCSWEEVTLKDYDAIQTIYHSPLLTTLTTDDNFKMDHQNATGYVLKINSGLLDICTHLYYKNQLSFEPIRCKQTIARPSIEAHIGIPFGESYAISEAFRNRNNVRETCMKTRQENGLQMVF
ncbi:unnamed protein product [Adineta steineri]|uniref:Uncharacterized protein n=1 Tax=Adineta steineri TaxID=433720 RepID=A0A814SGH8_9BILA|nr:unnamed protein product [Adineta steineri]